MSDALRRIELLKAFSVAKRMLREANGNRPPDDMTIAILGLMESGIAAGNTLSILAKAFTACFGYLKAHLPVNAFDLLREAFVQVGHDAEDVGETVQ